uniref:Uncharacterized protein n=1 Tax=Arundo donax TaxID=35708 RepID=A0A0A9AYP1_ARUDO
MEVKTEPLHPLLATNSIVLFFV